MPLLAVMFQSSFKSGGMNWIQPSVLSFVWKWNLIRFAKLMAIPMHIHQQSLRRDKSLNCSSQDFPGELKKWRLCRALKLACKFILNYPFSEIAVRLIHLKKNNVRVPASSPKTHVKKSPQTMALIFRDKSWPLKLISHKHYGKSSAHWVAFTRETSLKVEDVCVQALLKGTNIKFRESIFRTTDKTWVYNNTMQYDKAEEASL